ncbi:hypothetical protein [Caulobacter rhizosphaerae]|uniref:hypothetical protein n=1 Tax=Caulobacter rhizosphaerae TaxID=2010972 RepID=UPI0013D15129|nr:hypothetical protein [Caulobacter rhizosphaerae]
MRHTPDIDFARIRPHRGGRAMGFEELTRQLLIAEPPSHCIGLEHKGPGADGGVEILSHLSDGSVIGFQTKYHTEAFGAGQIAQIKTSFDAALTAYPRMREYVVVLPRNLSGGVKGKARSQRALWEAFATQAEQQASALGRAVKISLWDESLLIGRLTRLDPVHAGLRLYWFDQVSLTQAWFEARFQTTRADLSERYLPDDHVDVEIQRTLDTTTRGRLYRDAVAQHLESLALASKALEPLARAAPDLADDHAVHTARTALDALRQAATAVEFLEPTPIDLAALVAAMERFQRSALVDAVRRAWRGDAPSGLSREAARTREHYCGKASEAFADASRTLANLNSPLLQRPALLISGEAGAGKSHILAHLVEHHVAQAAPALLLLGQHFGQGDPRGQILERLGLVGWAFEDFLGALNAAALAAGRPALLVIDAINEAVVPQIWSATLAGLAVDIGRFPALALIVSCREVYEPMCIPPTWAGSRVVHRGFAGDEGEAAKAYLDRHGIDRPAAPFLDPGFTNPLLLATCVRRLNAEGRKAFPAGVEGVSELFEFWLDGVEAQLVRRGYDRIAHGDGRLRRALSRLADQMALERCEALPILQAQALLEQEVNAIAPRAAEDQLLRRLIAEGVLRRDPAFGGQEETVSFTFQRFSDHFIAQAILRLFDTAPALAAALKAGGDLAYILAEPRRHAGVIEALMVQVPERLGVELVDLEHRFTDAVKLPVTSFLQSLQWRADTATSSRTVEIFQGCWADQPESGRRFIGMLLRLASHPRHALNADYLHARLGAMPMAERDAELAPAFYDALHQGEAAPVLIDWSLSARTDLADPERVRLVVLTLGWFLAAPSRPLRDRATKALTALFLRSPEQMAPALRAFLPRDDAYVRERILAAAYGAACHLAADAPAVLDAARLAYDNVFRNDPIERHAYVRHYARGLVNLATSQGPVTDLDPARVAPPFASEPITSWPDIADLRPHEESARAVLWSTVGHLPASGGTDMAGDFGRYVMGALGRDFSQARMAQGKPEPIGAAKTRFWDSVRALPSPLPDLATAALEAHDALATRRQQNTLAYFMSLRSGGKVEDDPAALALDAKIAKEAQTAERALRKALPRGLRLKPSQSLPYPAHDDRQYSRFNLALGQRWVAARVLELGWSKDLHAAAEREAGYHASRKDHINERIGKKYQWIAFHELIGYLADHHWRVGYDESPTILENLVDLRDVDLDPSFFPPKPNGAPREVPSLSLPPLDLPSPTSLEAAKIWVRDLCDLPYPPDCVEGRGHDGDRWWWLGGGRDDKGYYDKLQSVDLVQTGTASLEMIVLPLADAQRLHDALRGFKKPDNDADEEGWPTPRLFAEFRPELTPADDAILHRAIGGIRYGRLTDSVQPHRGEYDHGGHGDISFSAPRRWVLRALDLRPAGPSSPWFVNGQGRVGLVSPSAVGREGGAIINLDLLEPVLAARGLTGAWLVWAEKEGGYGAGPDYARRQGLACQVFGGLWWKDGDRWRGSNWRANEEMARA